MLNVRRKTFCREYTVDFNGTQAALKAGFSKSSAAARAYELLQMPEIQEEIKRLITERNDNTEDKAQRVIQELEAVAYAKTTDFVKVKDIFENRNGRRRKVRVAYIELTGDVPEEKQKAIAEIRQTKDGIALKSHDKVKALELLGKHLGIFEKDNKQKQPKVNLGDSTVTFE